MPTKRLTDKAVEKISAPPGKRVQIFDAEVGGLVLRVSCPESGSRVVRSWSVMYRLHGSSQQQRLTLGRAEAMDVSTARDQAKKVLRAARNGEDPKYVLAREQADAEQERRRTVTDAVERYVEWVRDEKGNRSWQDTKRQLENWAIKEWAEWPVSRIRPSDVIGLRDKVARTSGRHAARKLVSALSAMFRWAADEKLIELNPAAGVRTAKVNRRQRVLTDEELAELWQASGTLGYPYGALFRLLVCTAARRDEIAKMRWRWLVTSGTGRDVVIPANRYKTGSAFVIPLSTLAEAVLATVPLRNDPDAPVFAGNARRSRKVEPKDGLLPVVPVSGFNWLKRALDSAVVKARARRAEEAGDDPEQVRPMEDWEFHDVRRTVRTNLPRLGVDPFVAERVLGHAIPGVGAHYDHWGYGPQKRDALERWADHLRKLIGVQAVEEKAA